MDHPYKNAPPGSLWKQAVSQGFMAEDLIDGPPLLGEGDKVMSAGSCFAANIVPWLEGAGITYVWTERPHPLFAMTHKEALSYHKFSAAYGNIYTTRHLKQLMERALGRFQPAEDRWHVGGRVIDPYRPGLAFAASSDFEFDLLTRQHLDCVVAAVEQADVFIFTLGLTEAWVSRQDGAVFPACPGTVAGTFEPDLHAFANFSMGQVTADLMDALALMREVNPRLRIILSVSPVPLVATAMRKHVLLSNTYSKSVLRVAAEEVIRRLPEARYFPAYEIVTGPQAPHSFFEADRREPSEEAIRTVMGVFLTWCGRKMSGEAPQAQAEVSDAVEALIDYECEEAAAAVSRK